MLFFRLFTNSPRDIQAMPEARKNATARAQGDRPSITWRGSRDSERDPPCEKDRRTPTPRKDN